MMANKATILTATQFQATKDNIPIAFGSVDIFLEGTVTRANSWKSSNKGVLNTNPILLDKEGKADIFLDDTVSYDITIKNKEGAVIKALDGFESNVPLETVINLGVVAPDAKSLVITNSGGDNATLESVTTATAGILSVNQYVDILATKSIAEGNVNDINNLKAEVGWNSLTITNSEFQSSWINYKKISDKLIAIVGKLAWDTNGSTEVIATLPFSLPYRVSFSSHSNFPQEQNDIIGGNGQLTISSNGEIFFYRGANSYIQYVNGVFIRV